MNDHLISRSRFLDALVLDADHKTDLIQVHQALEKAVISPDEVRGVGKWIGSMAGLRCSICNEPLGLMVGAKNYCPNCGAKMKGAEDGTTYAE